MAPKKSTSKSTTSNQAKQQQQQQQQQQSSSSNDVDEGKISVDELLECCKDNEDEDLKQWQVHEEESSKDNSANASSQKLKQKHHVKSRRRPSRNSSRPIPYVFLSGYQKYVRDFWSSKRFGEYYREKMKGLPREQQVNMQKEVMKILSQNWKWAKEIEPYNSKMSFTQSIRNAKDRNTLRLAYLGATIGRHGNVRRMPHENPQRHKFALEHYHKYNMDKILGEAKSQ
jgi:hypothetical protein